MLMMGMFHMLMMFKHTLSKRFSAAALRDLVIQSGIIAEGSVDKALSGKMYTRGVWLYKLAYEAITRKLLDGIVITGSKQTSKNSILMHSGKTKFLKRCTTTS